MITAALILAATATPMRIEALPAPDQITIVEGAHRTTVPLAGVMAPTASSSAERRWHRELVAAAQSLWQGRVIRKLIPGRRGLVVVLDDGTNLSHELVRAGVGLAEPSNGELARLEREARRGQRGLWSLAGWNHRRALELEPVVIPAGALPQPRHRGLAERLDPQDLRPWAERLEEFEQTLLAATTSAAGEDEEPEP